MQFFVRYEAVFIFLQNQFFGRDVNPLTEPPSPSLYQIQVNVSPKRIASSEGVKLPN